MFQYILKKKTSWFLAILTLLWTIVLLGMIFTIVYALYTTPTRIGDLLWVVVLMIIVFLFAFDYFNWQIRGNEILIVNDNNIEIQRKGTFFKRQLLIDFSELDRITFDDNKKTPYWIRFWGFGGGLIIIEYLGRKKRLGQDLQLKEAEEICIQINNDIRRLNNLTD